MEFEPDALFGPCPIDVEVDGRVYTIPSLPAADWCLAVMAQSYMDVVPGLIPDNQAGPLDEALIAGRLYAECKAAARAAIGAAAGAQWWPATRLTLSMSVLAGELHLRGVDPYRVSYGAYLAATYQAATRTMTRKDRARFDRELMSAPAGLPPEEWYDEDHAASLFEAAMSRAG